MTAQSLALRCNRSLQKSRPRRRPSRILTSLFDLLEDRRMLSATLWVDNNPADTNPHDFSTIQAAVNAAHVGDTIKVAPGTYLESVSVNTQGLTILGGQPRLSGESGPTIVESDTASFTLGANGISLEHFTFQPALNPEGVDGVVTSNSPTYSGYNIIDDTFLNEAVGLYLNTTTNNSTKPTTVSSNRFLNNAGSTNQDGIFSDSGLANTTISNNYFTADTDASIKLTGSRQSNVQILNNQIYNDAEILVVNLSNSKIDGNTIINPNGNGIELGGNVTGTEVAKNNLSTTIPCINPAAVNAAVITGPESLDGIVLAEDPNSGDTVSSNTVHGFDVGISLTDAINDTVCGNTVWQSVTDGIDLINSSCITVTGNSTNQNHVNGIELSGSNGNTLSHNTSNDNSQDGILLLLMSSCNTVSCNTADYNGNDGIEVANPINLPCIVVQPNLTSVRSTSSATNNTITGNTTNYNSVDGIAVNNSLYNLVSNNTSDYNGADGIDVLNSNIGSTTMQATASVKPSNTSTTSSGLKNNTVSGNVTNYNSSDGIALNNSNFDTVSCNCSNLNGNDGIDVVNSNPGLPSVNGPTIQSNANSKSVTLSGGPTNDSITSNTTNYNSANGIALNGGSTYVTISGNTANHNVQDGIALLNSSNDNTVCNNTADYNGGNGIHVLASSYNTVSGNTLLKNIGAGIFVNSTSMFNTFSNNTAQGNVFFDLFDASSGAGTAGTANTWQNNHATTRSPSNLK